MLHILTGVLGLLMTHFFTNGYAGQVIRKSAARLEVKQHVQCLSCKAILPIKADRQNCFDCSFRYSF